MRDSDARGLYPELISPTESQQRFRGVKLIDAAQQVYQVVMDPNSIMVPLFNPRVFLLLQKLDVMRCDVTCLVLMWVLWLLTGAAA